MKIGDKVYHVVNKNEKLIPTGIVTKIDRTHVWVAWKEGMDVHPKLNILLYKGSHPNTNLFK